MPKSFAIILAGFLQFVSAFPSPALTSEPRVVQESFEAEKVRWFPWGGLRSGVWQMVQKDSSGAVLQDVKIDVFATSVTNDFFIMYPVSSGTASFVYGSARRRDDNKEFMLNFRLPTDGGNDYLVLNSINQFSFKGTSQMGYSYSLRHLCCVAHQFSVEDWYTSVQAGPKYLNGMWNVGAYHTYWRTFLVRHPLLGHESGILFSSALSCREPSSSIFGCRGALWLGGISYIDFSAETAALIFPAQMKPLPLPPHMFLCRHTTFPTVAVKSLLASNTPLTILDENNQVSITIQRTK